MNATRLRWASFLSVAGLLAASGVLVAVEPLQRPLTVRVTDDRDHDLIEALVSDGRFAEALGLCQQGFQRAARTSDVAARWAIRESKVLTRQMLAGNQFNAEGIKQAAKPVADLLSDYPEHRRALFLKAQQLDVDQQAARHQVVQAGISPDDSMKTEATKTLVRVTKRIQSLIREIAEVQSESHRVEVRKDGRNADLVRLARSLRIDVLSLDLAQTELFSPGSDDRIAAATRAEQAADEALQRISVDTAAGMEIQRLKIEAILRSGQLARAEALSDAVFASNGKSLSARDRAVWVSVLIANDRSDRAENLLAEFFGEDAVAAPRSIALDLVRLEFLLRFRTDQVGGWFDAIEQRGGPYARRRAELVALQFRRPADSNTPVDATLIAAAGRDWLRRGDPLRGADLLASAAQASEQTAPATDSDAIADRALRYATEAAAAYIKGGNVARAADVLIDQATRHQDLGGAAAAAHLQAIYLLRADQPQRIEPLLRTQLEYWPRVAASSSARRWLAKLLNDQQRFLEAAELMSNSNPIELTPETVDAIAQAWRRAFHDSSDATLEIPSQRFRLAMKPLLENDAMRQRYWRLASTLLNREFFDRRSADHPTDRFATALVKFRKTGTVSPDLLSLPVDRQADARWRLIRDGRLLPQQRAAIAEVLRNWQPEAEPSFEQAELSQWSGQWSESIQMIEPLVAASPRDLEVIERAATLLGSADHTESRQMAIRYWDEIAAGTHRESAKWHQAKLAAIDLLRSIGSHQMANQRAKYILLTMPHLDPDQKARYQRVE